MLIPIHSVLSKQQVSECRQALDNDAWQDGKLTAGSQAAEIKTNLQQDDQSPIVQKLGNTILTALSVHPQFISAALPRKIYPPKFNCYRDSGHYGLHVDNAVMPLPHQQDMIRTDLSATLFLSEPEDYEGGELVIETDYGAQSIKLDAGDMILYPSTSLHQVTPVTHGERVSAFFWIQSMVREASQRTLLFDLDQSIQALTAEKGGNDNEVKRLTGVYHNLVRLWVDV